jgi:hypothetical protein
MGVFRGDASPPLVMVSEILTRGRLRFVSIAPVGDQFRTLGILNDNSKFSISVRDRMKSIFEDSYHPSSLQQKYCARERQQMMKRRPYGAASLPLESSWAGGIRQIRSSVNFTNGFRRRAVQ